MTLINHHSRLAIIIIPFQGTLYTEIKKEEEKDDPLGFEEPQHGTVRNAV